MGAVQLLLTDRFLEVREVIVGGESVWGARFRDPTDPELDAEFPGSTWVVWRDGWGQSLVRDQDVSFGESNAECKKEDRW